MAIPTAAPAAAARGEKTFRTELNPVDLLVRAAYVYPEKVAIVDGERRLTYREFGEHAWRLANALRAAGLQKGDRVATLLANSPAMLGAHFGVPAAGGILVTVNTRLSGAEIAYILEHSGSRTRRRRSRSTTPRARPAGRRACSTRIAARTSAR